MLDAEITSSITALTPIIPAYRDGMDTVDVVGLLAPITYFVLPIAEKLWPARASPERRRRHCIGIAFLILNAPVYGAGNRGVKPALAM